MVKIKGTVRMSEEMPSARMRYPSLVEREYKRYVLTNNNDLCYLRHPSGVIVVTLNRKHEAMRKRITKVGWQMGKHKRTDRSQRQVTGKAKKVLIYCCRVGNIVVGVLSITLVKGITISNAFFHGLFCDLLTRESVAR